jgi:hypothetical protein
MIKYQRPIASNESVSLGTVSNAPFRTWEGKAAMGLTIATHLTALLMFRITTDTPFIPAPAPVVYAFVDLPPQAPSLPSQIALSPIQRDSAEEITVGTIEPSIPVSLPAPGTGSVQPQRPGQAGADPFQQLSAHDYEPYSISFSVFEEEPTLSVKITGRLSELKRYGEGIAKLNSSLQGNAGTKKRSVTFRVLVDGRTGSMTESKLISGPLASAHMDVANQALRALRFDPAPKEVSISGLVEIELRIKND